MSHTTTLYIREELQPYLDSVGSSLTLAQDGKIQHDDLVVAVCLGTAEPADLNSGLRVALPLELGVRGGDGTFLIGVTLTPCNRGGLTLTYHWGRLEEEASESQDSES